MKIFFLRHGIAQDAVGGLSDRDRALTDEGREQMQRSARGMQRLGVKPDVILSSPLIRARQTAEIVAEALGSRLEIVGELQPGCLLEDLQRALRHHHADTVMVVGHQPDLAAMAARLINADERGILLKKGGMIRVEIDGKPQAGRGRLFALFTPKMLGLMAGMDTETERSVS